MQNSLTESQPLPFERYRDVDWLGALTTAFPPPGNAEPELRKKVKAARDQLLAQGVGQLSPDELLRLSGYQLRLRDSAGAAETLRLAKQKCPQRFETFAHLAVFHMQSGQLDEALAHEELAVSLLRDAPASPAATWMKLVERTYRKLLMRRRAEPARQPGGPAAPDALFDEKDMEDGVKRTEALAVVQALSLSAPEDSRLQWLLADLYAKDKEPAAAATILDSCVNNGFSPPALRELRRQVKQAAEAQALLAEQASAEAANAPPPPPVERAWGIDPVRVGLAIALAVGILGLFLFLQLRETRRRRTSG